MIDGGAARKSPAWRLGCWLLGVAVILTVILDWPVIGSLGWLPVDFAVFLVGLALTAPHTMSRWRGSGPYVPEPSPIKVKDVTASTFLAFLVLYRLPVAVGDAIYTLLWNVIARAARSPGELPLKPDPLGRLPGEDDDQLWRTGANR